MKKLFFTFLCLRMAFCPLFAQSTWIVSGNFKYLNTESTPMDVVKVVLKLGTARVDSVMTDAAGHYAFAAVSNGTYKVLAYTSKPWNSVNATDAIKVQRHFAGIEIMTEPVKLQAADVNLSNSINGTDAVKIKRRVAALENYFDRGDWTIAKLSTGGDTIIVNGAAVIQDFNVLCVGDVNGSNIPAPTQELPVVLTAAAAAVSPGAAGGGGNVFSEGGVTVTSRGVCWSTSSGPTIDGSHTTDGGGNGIFASSLTGLISNTVYYIRAYATNSLGTAYGQEVSCTTQPWACGFSFSKNHLVTGGVAPVDKTTVYGSATNITGEPAKCWITSNKTSGFTLRCVR